MRKEVITVLLVALALTLASCAPQTPSTPGSSTPFIGGNSGLTVSFVENAPPSEVLDNPTPTDKTKAMRFDIVTRLENVGEQDVIGGNAKITIGGIYPADFDKSTAQMQDVPFTKNLLGVKKDPDGTKIPGSIEEMTFKDLAYLGSMEGNNNFPVQADLCYKYKTRAVADFCMRQDITKATSGVCNVKGTKNVYSSGAPIHVVSLDESVGGRTKVILRFKIKVDGAGSFFAPDAAGAPNCARGDFSKENFVKVTVKSAVPGIECSGLSGTQPSGNIRLSNGEASVTCFQSNVNVDAVQKLNIELEYNHLISASTNLLVKHLPTDTPVTSGAAGTGATGTSAPAAPQAPATPGTSTPTGIQHVGGVYFVPTASQSAYNDLKNNCKLNGAVFDDTSVSGTARCYCPDGSRWVSPAPSDASKISLPDIARGCVGTARLAELKVPNAGIVGSNAYVSKFVTGTSTVSTYYTNLQTICGWVNNGAFTDTAADESGQILGKCPCPTGKTWANANDVTQLCT